MQIQKPSQVMFHKAGKIRYLAIKLIVLLLSVTGLKGVYAQETINVAGGDANGNGGSVSYSIGQMVYTIAQGTSGSISKGVQQPFEISVITSTGLMPGINLSCIAYPNPVNDFLILEVENFDQEDLSYYLYDLNGRLLESGNITGGRTTISMTHHVPALYFLKVTAKQKEIKLFKIIKN